jgi:prophage regulatory protein
MHFHSIARNITRGGESMRVIRRSKIHQKTGLSITQIWRLEKAGLFPKKIKLGANSVGWLESEVDAWIAARVKERDDATEAA